MMYNFFKMTGDRQMTKISRNTPSKPIPVNPTLVWDYEIPPEENQTDSFRRWYLSRVLTRGSRVDLQTIGLETIYIFFPDLYLPPAVRRFWEWYFNLPEVKPRYENTDTFSAKDHRSNQ